MPRVQKILFLAILAVFGFFSLSPNLAEAKSAKHYILINYRGNSSSCSPTANDQVANFSWGGWRLQSGITDYRINFSTLPSNLSRESTIAIFDLAFSNIQGAGGGVLFHYAGASTESSPTNNGQNTVMWRTLPSNMVAVTYIWIDDNGRLVNADTVFNRVLRWTYTPYNGQNDCGGNRSGFDLRNVATHEFGHWAGMGDLYNSTLKDLTMYGYTSRGELKKDTLGVGDVIGVRAVWP